jgi:hypothetical protein
VVAVGWRWVTGGGGGLVDGNRWWRWVGGGLQVVVVGWRWVIGDGGGLAVG